LAAIPRAGIARLKGYLDRVGGKLKRSGVQVVNLGLVDTPEKALASGHRFRRANVDLIFCTSPTSPSKQNPPPTQPPLPTSKSEAPKPEASRRIVRHVAHGDRDEICGRESARMHSGSFNQWRRQLVEAEGGAFRAANREGNAAAS
jgi:hypothetical protein